MSGAHVGAPRGGCERTDALNPQSPRGAVPEPVQVTDSDEGRRGFAGALPGIGIVNNLAERPRRPSPSPRRSDRKLELRSSGASTVSTRHRARRVPEHAEVPGARSPTRAPRPPRPRWPPRGSRRSRRRRRPATRTRSAARHARRRVPRPHRGSSPASDPAWASSPRVRPAGRGSASRAVPVRAVRAPAARHEEPDPERHTGAHHPDGNTTPGANEGIRRKRRGLATRARSGERPCARQAERTTVRAPRCRRVPVDATRHHCLTRPLSHASPTR